MVKRSRILAFVLIVALIGSLMGLTTQGTLNNIKLGLDLQGGFEVLYQVETKDGSDVDENVLSSTVQALDRRINVLGVSEPSIQIEGEDRIRVQLPGVEDQNEARELLSTQAELTFRDVNDEVKLDGSDLVENGARPGFNPDNNQPIVSVKLKDADKFGQVTQEILNMGQGNNVLAIWLDFEEGESSFKKAIETNDPALISYPSVDTVLNTTDVQISGSFTVEETKNLADLLNAGSLPVELTELYSTSVGAQFGEQALDLTVKAGIIGIIAVFLFMIAFYRFPGLIAVVTLSTYIYVILVVFDWMNGVLTLPGIAALILGVGMAVDANIITYERIKDELRVGRSLRSAFQAGNKSSFLTIVDANITTLLAGGVLFYFGNSSVKGFATMLIVSILTSFLTAVWGTRLLLGLWVKSNIFKKKPTWFGVKQNQIKDLADNYTTNELETPFDKFDFVKLRNKFFILSGLLITTGLAVLFIFKLNLGIDFVAGTRVEVMSDNTITAEEVSQKLEEINLESSNIVLGGDNFDRATIRYAEDLSQQDIALIKDTFKEEYGIDPNVSTVSPMVGEELAKNAMISVAIAAIGIVLYVTIRFEWAMAVGSIVALLHDAFFIIAIFSLTRLEVDLTFIAAVLTIVGYSINDTIVTFDRMREIAISKKKLKTEEDIAAVVNVGLRQTLVRSLNTVLTVVITVVALLIFGAESIRNFSIALLIGLVAGTYSSIFIAAQLWYVFKVKELKRKGTIITEKVKKYVGDEPQV
ncbi:protein translocase subunit SecDF [Mangrovibacillus cuniculi]|uniref:Multifunctional fusion protein n=1 Tax=Mangrovibacillus cuniculi TaxID=2593652 RepID=A0A7S8HFN5_9BACI|nr:protein translocase subunit SecDF [Mangrovibacillus cuniculi]QPC47018.1 protein translocase subunit SecDF [Mangrovibacillus cuniculi]